ncbi:hypothetical protein DTO164E3_5369 [Paecilomyces variotii]|uniref:R3H-associated N-terminal domain-containing protein n=1 Tax=Byssochlamys spectabilis TaxID=264951 RepID=A0A443HR41_BYSSP|nr:R3H-associated N-terminal domain-containing protein [Paecilomyces variotii]KAJ9194391.1 hypothetical protein DTO032I3_7409 [Paecilomyces variotii]KAJ9198113.1 hypothetical protein DTO164E3_5369 [Paecilomyces variotii]KAJ9222398.1 hypothetical protein DTO169C6_5333 [Paecilomyces variotii]KAJ9281219.1 hypothetical protein DTO021D3_1878 [Paecilomyces variotii]KAJ9285755.1 hypothetical protein DTO021C3_6722 [Paecilomyces variotii]
MAIHPTLQTAAPGTLTAQQARAISAWTEQTTASLQNLTISQDASTVAAGTVLRGTSVSLTIPLDDHPSTTEPRPAPRAKIANGAGEERPQRVSLSYRHREPSRRDSLKRREALLKGKEGSRRRQRWENDRLLNNPWAQPPAPTDWLPQPTYPRHETVPYYLAPLWDAHYAHQDRTHSKRSSKREEKHQIPKELRMRLKHARAARGLLQDLEEDIRHFVQKWNEKQLMLEDEGLTDAPSPADISEDEDEIVFVGRNGQMHDSPERKRVLRQMRKDLSQHQERDGEKMVFESLAGDRGAGFGRWLVHSIASYYGLHTWSVTMGNPSRRAAFVGFYPPPPSTRDEQVSLPPASMTASRRDVTIKPGEPLPRPLWAQI